ETFLLLILPLPTCQANLTYILLILRVLLQTDYPGSPNSEQIYIHMSQDHLLPARQTKCQAPHAIAAYQNLLSRTLPTGVSPAQTAHFRQMDPPLSRKKILW